MLHLSKFNSFLVSKHILLRNTSVLPLSLCWKNLQEAFANIKIKCDDLLRLSFILNCLEMVNVANDSENMHVTVSIWSAFSLMHLFFQRLTCILLPGIKSC